MSSFEAFFLGLLQGLTEFLPVSSSGHLEIGKAILGTEIKDDLLFTVMLHAATVLSTICAFYKEIGKLFAGLFRFGWNEETQYIAKIIVSMIPVGIVGVFFKEEVEQLFGNGLFLVGCMLLLTALLLTLAYYKKSGNKELTFKNTFVIGISQAIAIFPGLSRSGTTIATGLLLGCKREQIAQFSFLMVLLPILGENFLDLIGGEFANNGIGTTPMLIGFVTAFVSGFIACKWMI